MPSVEKIIEKMKRQPNGIRPEEADKVLRAYGYEGVRQKGSHKQYLNKETGDLTTIKQPIKESVHSRYSKQDRGVNPLTWI